MSGFLSLNSGFRRHQVEINPRDQGLMPKLLNCNQENPELDEYLGQS